MEDEEALRLDEETFDLMGGVFQHHFMPTMALGNGSTTLSDKSHPVMYSFFLEAGSSSESVAEYCRSMVCGTFDSGVEFSLPVVQNIGVATSFPWVESQTCSDSVVFQEGDDFEVLEDESPIVDIGLDGALHVPGLLHVIHNAGSDLLAQPPALDGVVDKLSHIAKLISEEQSCDRLIETCFSTPVGQNFHKDLRSFNGKVYRACWLDRILLPDIVGVEGCVAVGLGARSLLWQEGGGGEASATRSR